MPVTILLPALSPTMEEGTVANWLVAEGDTVRIGDLIAEIETDKATMELEAEDDGVIGRILVAAGTEEVPVQTPIAILLTEGEEAAALEGYEPEVPAQISTPVAPSKKPASQPSLRMETPATTMSEGPQKVFASPLARRLSDEHQIPLDHITGSGPKGRIVKRDVEAAIAAGGDVARVGRPGAVQNVPLNAMRKTIARRMQAAANEIPHFYLTIDCNIDALIAARAQFREEDGISVSVTDFIVKAVAETLLKVPEVNRSWAETHLIQHAAADIAIAVAVDAGLFTPIIWGAEQLGLAEISEQTKTLGQQAREGQLKPDQYTGGTFSISNLGMHGVRDFTAVINPPHAAILAVGAGEKKVIVNSDMETEIATIMCCTLGCDHRVFDGATGARFLSTLKGYIEAPLRLLL